MIVGVVRHSPYCPSMALPIDIIQSIISSLWSMPLSPSQRAFFMKSSLLVSKSWRAVFLPVAATDIYILGPSHGSLLLDILHGKRESRDFFYTYDTHCRSITFQHENKYLLPGPASQREQPMGFIIRDILHELSRSPERLPMFRRISIELKNYLMETIFEGNDSLFSCFPKQVMELDIHFTYGEDTYPLVVRAIKSRDYERFGLKAVNGSDVRELRVFGTSSGVAKELLEVFGGRESLQVFEQDAWEEERKKPVFFEDDPDDEEFFDCETELRLQPVNARDSIKESVEQGSWAEYESMLVASFSKEDLSRILSALRTSQMCGVAS
ncbi:hypothetical protein L218DRAFT_350627 [Marasmius fiardii PR-910]|nr:hypothetical protein L218DRAFT_350627 [Marasmius fiardii PR-910]